MIFFLFVFKPYTFYKCLLNAYCDNVFIKTITKNFTFFLNVVLIKIEFQIMFIV